jgi:hypothetical protein
MSSVEPVQPQKPTFGQEYGASIHITYNFFEVLKLLLTNKELELLSPGYKSKDLTLNFSTKVNPLVVMPSQDISMTVSGSGNFGIGSFYTGNCQLSFFRYFNVLLSYSKLTPAQISDLNIAKLEAASEKVRQFFFAILLKAASKRLMLDIQAKYDMDYVNSTGLGRLKMVKNETYTNTNMTPMRHLEYQMPNIGEFYSELPVKNTLMPMHLEQYLKKVCPNADVNFVTMNSDAYFPKVNPKNISIIVPETREIKIEQLIV